MCTVFKKDPVKLYFSLLLDLLTDYLLLSVEK